MAYIVHKSNNVLLYCHKFCKNNIFYLRKFIKTNKEIKNQIHNPGSPLSGVTPHLPKFQIQEKHIVQNRRAIWELGGDSPVTETAMPERSNIVNVNL